MKSSGNPLLFLCIFARFRCSENREIMHKNSTLLRAKTVRLEERTGKPRRARFFRRKYNRVILPEKFVVYSMQKVCQDKREKSDRIGSFFRTERSEESGI